MVVLFGILFGGVFWYVGLRGFIGALDFTTRGCATTGTVTSIVREAAKVATSSGWTTTVLAHPAVQFEPMPGESVTFTTASGGSYHVGQVVPVLYDRTNPHRAVISSFGHLWVGPGIAVTTGAILFLLTLWGHPLAMGAVVLLCLLAAARNAWVMARHPAAPSGRLPLELRIWIGAFKAVVAGILGLVTLVLLFGTIDTYSRHAALASQAARYDRAPGCLDPGSAGAAAGCHTESARVVGKDVADWSRHGQPTAYYLHLVRANGQRATVEVDSQGSYVGPGAPAGDRVVVQVWEGRLTIIWAGPYTMRTDQNPDVQNINNTSGLVLLPFFTIMFGFFTVGVAFARPRRLPTSPSVEATTARQPDDQPDGHIVTAPVHAHARVHKRHRHAR